MDAGSSREGQPYAGTVMNFLRRAASIPGVRVVLLQPDVRRAVASVLALRFLVAAWVTTKPFAVLAGEALSRGEVRTYLIRAQGFESPCNTAATWKLFSSCSSEESTSRRVRWATA